MGYFALQQDLDDLRSEVAILSQRIDVLLHALTSLGIADARLTSGPPLLDRVAAIESA
jgi:hypothetical protein